MTDELKKLTKEVLEGLDEQIEKPFNQMNEVLHDDDPFEDKSFAAYRIISPYRVELSLPEDDHNTKLQIDTKSEEVCFARSEGDVRLTHELNQRHSKLSYSKHITRFVRDHMWMVSPEDMTITYTGAPTITRMTTEETNEYEREMVIYDD